MCRAESDRVPQPGAKVLPGIIRPMRLVGSVRWPNRLDRRRDHESGAWCVYEILIDNRRGINQQEHQGPLVAVFRRWGRIRSWIYVTFAHMLD